MHDVASVTIQLTVAFPRNSMLVGSTVMLTFGAGVVGTGGRVCPFDVFTTGCTCLFVVTSDFVSGTEGEVFCVVIDLDGETVVVVEEVETAGMPGGVRVGMETDCTCCV